MPYLLFSMHVKQYGLVYDKNLRTFSIRLQSGAESWQPEFQNCTSGLDGARAPEDTALVSRGRCVVMKKLNESEGPSPNIRLTVWWILRVPLTNLANDHQKQPHI